MASVGQGVSKCFEFGVWSDDEEEPVPLVPDETITSSECDVEVGCLEVESEELGRMRLSNKRRERETCVDGGGRVPGVRKRGGKRRSFAAFTGSTSKDDEGGEPKVYGLVPDELETDTDVYRKYSFETKKYDTKLAIFKMRSKILSTIKDHQVVTIEGFTGCGKTTQVPQFILDEAVENNVHCKIVVTQPRRIAAISVANRVASERKWRTGGIIGYQVGMDRMASEDTRLFYMTTGVLLQLLIGRKSLREWTHIIIDEVHERDLETDLLLLVIKKLMMDTTNHPVRIVMMSATLNAQKFSFYYPSLDSLGQGAANVKIDLDTIYPIEDNYIEDAIRETGSDELEIIDEPRLSKNVAELALRIIESFDQDEGYKSGSTTVQRGAVLVFLPGLLEIEIMSKTLLDANRPGTEEDRNWNVLPLHSVITSDEQQRVFIPSPNQTRKIILATNIAESSITVPDIRYVIDFCLTKNLSCDNVTNYSYLRLEWASKNECIQRRGRCGRVAPGKVYRLVPRKFYESLPQEATPEMLRSSLESVTLRVKLLGMGSPKSVLALAVDPPEECMIQKAACNLKEIGAMTILANGKFDAYDGDLTFMGRIISRLPIDIKLGRLILLGYAFDCLYEAVIIAAGLTVKTPFASPLSNRLDAYLQKLRWSQTSFCDCISVVIVYSAWFNRHNRNGFLNFNDEKQWAKKYAVQLMSLREMQIMIKELKQRLKMGGIDLETGPIKPLTDEKVFILKTVIAGAFYPNYFVRQRPDLKDYHKSIVRELRGHDPFNAVALQGNLHGQPLALYKKVIFDNLQYGNCVPQLESEGPKIIALYDSHGCYTGRISTAVYRAIKLRHLRKNVKFPIVFNDEARGYEKKGLASLSLLKDRICPKSCTLPPVETNSVQFIFTHSPVPDDFYIVLASEEINLSRIIEILQTGKNDLIPLSRERCNIGCVCVAVLDENYYRARIDVVKGVGDVFVTLIDTGCHLWLNNNNLFEFLEALKPAYEPLFKFPALAIKCKLKGVQQAARNEYTWRGDCVKKILQFFCEGSGFVMEIYGICNGVMCGTVFREVAGKFDPKSLNELLLELGYADPLDEENEGIEENACARERAQREVDPTLSSTYSRALHYQESPFLYEGFMDPIEIPPEQVAEVINLRGPMSPLEMSFVALCSASHLKHVQADAPSINSVVLDQNPWDQTYRLMVAASVTIAHRSGNIVARDTTLMPPVPGLTGILAMLFCPTLEFRTDPARSQYTGCVSGLGTDPNTGYSVYPDHDMEVVFETLFSQGDIEEINSIRAAVSEILTINVRQDKVIELRKDIAQRLKNLISSRRPLIEEVWPDQCHVWTKARNDSSFQGTGQVFPPLEPFVF